MAHYAQIKNNTVVQVVVVPDLEDGNSYLSFLGLGDGWVKTSYNTRGNVHYGENGKPDNGVPLRYNYAGVGFTYDSLRDAFIPPRPYPSWVLDEQTLLWEPPFPAPGSYPTFWDEENQQWATVEPISEQGDD